MNPETNYTPISCSYYDRLEALATTRERCEISYMESITGSTQRYVGLIVDIYSRDREEFMVMDSGLTLRLDHLGAINGIPNPSYAF